MQGKVAGHSKILLGVLVGAVAGIAANLLAGGEPWVAWAIENVAQPIGQVFLRLLFMLVIPLLFSALVMGVAELDLSHLGRLGGRMLAYTVVVSGVAVLIGLVLVNAFRPGEGLPDMVRELARSNYTSQAGSVAKVGSAVDFFVAMVPDNVFKAAAAGDMLAIIVFALVFGVALAFTRTPGGDRLREVIAGVYDVMMRLIEGVLKLAPIGVAALLFAMTARLGLDVLARVAVYVGVVLLGLAIHLVVVYSLSVRFLGGMSPVRFFRDVKLAMITAFSTASSSATLPTAIKVAEENLRLPRHVTRFVLTAGSAMNQNGTALFEGVTVLFVAQLFGVPLDLTDQAVIMGVCILGGVGTAGVPSGSIPVIAMILGMFDIPLEGLGLVLGVNTFLDMCRTTLNVTGDLAAAVYVARGEPVDGSSGPASVG
jgi:DAACS family dicarboxylate/amino acid:cation (Na+ or H+) symporter